MNRRMLQTALVSGALGVVAVAGLAVAQPAQTPGEALDEQEARAAQDDGLEIEDLLAPGSTGDATEVAGTTSVEDRTAETDGPDVVARATDSAGDLDSVDTVDDTDSPDDTESPDDTDADEDDSADSVDQDDSVDVDDSVDSLDSDDS